MILTFISPHIITDSKDNSLESIAEMCRQTHISRWIKRPAKKIKGARTKWRGELVKMLVRQTVLDDKAWEDVFTSAKTILSKKYPEKSGDIAQTIRKYLDKSPVEEFLKAEAYKWLKFLADNPPDAPSWFPHLTVEVAHKAFRLNGKITTFRKYLGHPSRKINIFDTGERKQIGASQVAVNSL